MYTHQDFFFKSNKSKTVSKLYYCVLVFVNGGGGGGCMHMALPHTTVSAPIFFIPFSQFSTAIQEIFSVM